MIKRIQKLKFWKTRRMLEEPNVVPFPKNFINQKEIVDGFGTFIVHTTLTDTWLRFPEDWYITEIRDSQSHRQDRVVVVLDNNDCVRICINLTTQTVQVVPAFSCSLAYDGSLQQFIATLYIKGAPELVFPYGAPINVVSINGAFETFIQTPFMKEKATMLHNELQETLIQLGVPKNNHVDSWNDIDKLALPIIDHFKSMSFN